MPTPRTAVAVSWSGGKDSTLALAAALADERLTVRAQGNADEGGRP